MLHKPDVNTVELTELADFIEALPPEKFSMKSFGQYHEPRCICGWLLHNHGHIYKDDIEQAGRILGIRPDVADRLFGASLGFTTKQAAAELRHLAVTGELSW